jgi:hypothetical protein
MATGKKTGGRRKGTPNRRTAELRAEMAASGEMPLDHLLRVMRSPVENASVRFQAAKAAVGKTTAASDGGTASSSNALRYGFSLSASDELRPHVCVEHCTRAL